MRFYVIDKNYQATETDAGGAVRRFTAWFADEAGQVLAGAFQAWLRRPCDRDGRGTL